MFLPEDCFRHHTTRTYLLGQSLHRPTLRVVGELACRAQLPAQPFPHRVHEAVVGNEERVTFAGRQVHELLPLLVAVTLYVGGWIGQKDRKRVFSPIETPRELHKVSGNRFLPRCSMGGIGDGRFGLVQTLPVLFFDNFVR